MKILLASLTYKLDAAGGAVKVETLPPCKGDTGVVSQFFANLLDNAVKYRDRSRKLEIIVRGERTGANTVIYTLRQRPRHKSAEPG